MSEEINICLFSLLWVILIIKFGRYALYVRYRHPNNQIKHRGNNG